MPQFTKQPDWVVISTIALLLVLPAIWHGVFDAMDLHFHLRWTEQFSMQLWQGEAYPRWLHNMNAGLGSPAFYYYAPAPFYLTSLFFPFFSPEARQWGQLSVSMAIALIASGFTAYLWLNLITNRKAALIGSLLYMALPYHLGVNLYWRFAFAEYWALVWLPLILYFTCKLNLSKFAILGLSFSYALLILTHLPSVVMFVPVSIAYLFFQAEHRVRALIKGAISLLLAIGLAAIYLIPALTMQGSISMNVILEKGYLYSNNFLLSATARLYHNPYFWLYVEAVSIGMTAIAICAYLITRTNRESQFWFGVSIVAFLMMLPVSLPIWAVLPPLQRIQFPWRFNSVLLISVTALIAVALERRRTKLFTIGLVLTIGLLLTNGVAMKLRLKPIKDPRVVRSIEINKELALEYRPKWVAPEYFTIDAIEQLAKLTPKVEINQWEPRQIAFRSNFAKETWVTLRQFYFPGWFAIADSLNLDVQPTEKTGLLRVKVPSGLQQVQVKLGQNRAEITGGFISAIALLIWVMLGIMFRFVSNSRETI